MHMIVHAFNEGWGGEVVSDCSDLTVSDNQSQLTLNRRGWLTLILRSPINPPSQFLSFHILEFLDH